jgi:hypothetical protein
VRRFNMRDVRDDEEIFVTRTEVLRFNKLCRRGFDEGYADGYDEGENGVVSTYARIGFWLITILSFFLGKYLGNTKETNLQPRRPNITQEQHCIAVPPTHLARR